MIWLISSARICMSASSSVENAAAQGGESRTQAAVENQAAHPGHHPTDERGVHFGLHQYLLAGAPLERALDLGHRDHVQRFGRRHRRSDAAELSVGELLV